MRARLIWLAVQFRPTTGHQCRVRGEWSKTEMVKSDTESEPQNSFKSILIRDRSKQGRPLESWLGHLTTNATPTRELLQYGTGWNLE